VRRLALIALLAAGLAVAGCGDKSSEVHEASTEGISVDVGPLVYQVQLSRYLNPNDVEDRDYLAGLPQGTPLDPGGSEIWFGVWMRVKNFSPSTQRPTTDFKITDTEGNSFTPIPQSRAVNPFIYTPNPIPHAGVLPVPDSAPASGPIQGSLILFRLKTTAISNRPLILHIAQGSFEPSIVDLDL
jgi:hypothetical protein